MSVTRESLLINNRSALLFFSTKESYEHEVLKSLSIRNGSRSPPRKDQLYLHLEFDMTQDRSKATLL